MVRRELLTTLLSSALPSDLRIRNIRKLGSLNQWICVRAVLLTSCAELRNAPPCWPAPEQVAGALPIRDCSTGSSLGSLDAGELDSAVVLRSSVTSAMMDGG
jgi:hypothetical protein